MGRKPIRRGKDRPPYSHTQIEDGEVVVVSLAWAEPGVVYGRTKWMLHCEIVDGEHRGKIILLSYNAPRTGWLAPSHRLAIDYCVVTGKRPPPIRKNITPAGYVNDFLDGVFVHARTHLVKERLDIKNRRRVLRPKISRYSVVDELVGLADGTPRVLRRSKTAAEDRPSKLWPES